ncbi:MAG: hypothetical protein Q7T74_06980 [Candidatus Saccharibacteria bacterium]|nr:hypothetical protein [Candidatus Saccharibacteria bacterium]
MLDKLTQKIKFSLARGAFLKRRASVYSQLAFALEHESDPKSEIENLLKIAKMRQSELEPVYLEWVKRFEVKAGRLALAMKGTVEESERTLIASAEETQNLASGLRFLARVTKQVQEMAKSIRSAFMSIVFPSVILFFVILFVDGYFFPILSESVPRSDWGAYPRAVASVAHFAKELVSFGSVFGLIAVFIWKASLPKWTGKFRTVLEKTPLYGKYRDLQCALFLMNLSFLTTAEIAPRDALERIQRHATPYIRSHIGTMLLALDARASDFGRVLVSTGLFNRELGDLIANYTRWTDWHTQLEEIATEAMDIVVRDLTELSPKIKEFLMAAVGVIVLILISSVALIILAMLRKSGINM